MLLRHPFFIIIRPLNVAIAGFSILLAASLVQPFTFSSSVLFAIVSGMLITAGANVINDIFDIDIDRVNKPNRILPAGHMTTQTAWTFTIFLFVCGLIFSKFINFTIFIIALSTSFILIIYSAWLKTKPLIGNLAVSLSAGLAFLYGTLAASHGSNFASESSTFYNNWRVGIFPAVFSFLFHFGREVIKDIEDQIGDQSVGARTLPLAYGLRSAQITVSCTFVILAGVIIVPYHLGIYNTLYILCVSVGIYPIIFYCLIQVWRNPLPKKMHSLSLLLKVGMLVGLAAIYLGQI